MTVTLRIPTALRSFTDRQTEVAVEGLTAGAALSALAERYPDIKTHLFETDGKLRAFINLYLDGKNIRNADGLNTPLTDGATLTLVPAIAGGNLEESLIAPKRLTPLNEEDLQRYSRHLILPEVGIQGQQRLKAAKVLVVGTGGLGAPLALYLAAAGVGVLGLVDFDTVEASNLQRQIIHSTRDLDRPKTASARDRVLGVNPNIQVVTHNTRLTSANALEILGQYDIVADGTDNFPTRYLINDACVLLGIPAVYGSIFQFEGQASVFYAKKGACYRCLYPAPPPPGLVPSCGEGGVLGVLPGIIGSIQANEVIKLIVGGGESLIGRLLLFDAWRMTFSELTLEKDPDCPICGQRPSIRELVDYEEFCGLSRKQEEAPVEEITAKELKTRLDQGDSIQLIDVREPHESAVFKFKGARAIPFGQLLRRMDEFNPKNDAVFICKVGQRSIYAIRALRDAGYRGRMLNLKDGSNAWAAHVDAHLPRY
ncbi:MAG: molybdopterin-synthase adenylyltransferase MoeB [Zoogloeaceae bacterium]|jgi:adenylyltransferase/sulfurtransferase|nr:molybdopterin-synthase adenylyltransferase MoeB [Zoogloeaceae bacterium]